MRRHGKGTELRDQILKSEARRRISETVTSSCEWAGSGLDAYSIRFEPIDHTALVASDSWVEGCYPWRSIPDWKLKDPKGFDLALWYGYELCGLCYATPRRSRLTIKIILLEGKPGAGHALKGLVAPLTLMAIDLYARLMNFREIEIQHPEPTAIRYYKVLGFRLDKAGRLVISVGDS